MPRGKLQPNIEREYHRHAYNVWRDLGYGRSYSKTARLVHSSKTSICKWAKIFKWADRLATHATVVAKKEEAGDMIKVDSPIARKLATAMDRVEALISSAFVVDRETGKLTPTIKLKTAEELTKLLAEYRKFLETYSKFVEEFQPDKKDKERGTQIKEFNVIIGDMSQEERIEMMKEITNGNVQRGHKQPAGGVQDADYTEVSERGNEDGHGRNGVSGSAASGSGGNKETMR